jgi:hypothetical protein
MARDQTRRAVPSSFLHRAFAPDAHLYEIIPTIIPDVMPINADKSKLLVTT